ncbi:hypothetical protein [Bradyrhizobium sp. JYMT SZCCT0180]|uniref:hypothetical protein n=1 Tax=Bradyrhizobium sp. JYMT SZCCT0180 TaxID=2807666 RepID=UPI001BABE6DA|nr:hypothetical protein [Bradyrhizobium sp. JYMT SZCCT0180]MBR1212566.1 hypothetical protein [Bradyrhizobium sp. JYMT SZCCT0180]
MSESETTTETVEIPGALTLSNPVPPPMTVPLPIVAWPHGVKNAWLGILFLVNAVIFLPVAAMLPVLVVHGMWDDFLTPKGAFASLILLFTFTCGLYFGGAAMGAALACFWDAARGDPVLEITADGLRDRRSGLSVLWTSVRSAKPVGLSVDLQLHGPVTNWQNPFRIGVLFQRRRLPDHMIVSVAYLDAPAHVLLYTILTLTQRNGGEVITKLPSGLELYPRLIPRRRPLSVAIIREVG